MKFTTGVKLLQVVLICSMCVAYEMFTKNWQSSTPNFVLHDARNRALAFTDDESQLATGGSEEIQIWEVKTGHLLQTLRMPSENVDFLAFAPQSTILASLVDEEAAVTQPTEQKKLSLKIWDARSGRLRRTIKNVSGLTEWSRLIFSPSGKLLASIIGNSWVYLWDVQTGSLLNKLKGIPSSLVSINFSPDGQLMACGHANGKIELLNIRTGKRFKVLQQRNTADTAEVSHSVEAVEFCSDGNHLATYGASEDIWDVRSGKLRKVVSVSVGEPYTFSANRHLLIVGSTGSGPTDIAHGVVEVYNVQDGKLILSLPNGFGIVRSVSLSPSSKVVAVGGEYGSQDEEVVTLWPGQW